jgi:hypothetical protein
MSASLSPNSHDFGNVSVGQSRASSFSVTGASFTGGEVTIDGQDRASFYAAKQDSNIDVTFTPGNQGTKVARLKVLIQSSGSPYWIQASLQGNGV